LLFAGIPRGVVVIEAQTTCAPALADIIARHDWLEHTRLAIPASTAKMRTSVALWLSGGVSPAGAAFSRQQRQGKGGHNDYANTLTQL
jgi:hypothetical protein